MRPSNQQTLVRRWHAAVGFTEHVVPSLVFVLAGVALGPQFLDILSVRVLAQFDPAVSVALAVLGVFVGSRLATQSHHGRASLSCVAGAGVQGFFTFGTVTLTMYLLLRQWGLSLTVDTLSGAAILGLCSVVSATVRVTESDPSSAAAHIANFNDLLLVVLGAFAVAELAGDPVPVAVLGLTVAAGLVIAAAGAVLFESSGNTPERGVFVMGTVVLLGGVAAYTGTSPLLSGCVAGLLWARARGPIASLVDSDIRRLRHPLVGILLVVAGASIQFTYQLLWLAAPLVLFRFTGKLIGSLAAAHLVGLPGGSLAAYLAPSGVLGIALALNIQQVLPTGDTLLVSAVTASSVGAEVLAVVLVVALHPLTLPREEMA